MSGKQLDFSTLKIWEVEQTPEGGAKVTTELNAEEIKAVLAIGLISLFAQALCPASMAHHFEEAALAELDEGTATVQ
jgi:hypothetical protein